MLRMIYLPSKYERDTASLAKEQIDEQLKDHKGYHEHRAALEIEAETNEKLKQVLSNLDDWVKKHKEETKSAAMKAVEDMLDQSRNVHFYDSEKKEYTNQKPKDWAFMEESGRVLKSYPNTWLAYPDTEAGVKSIIDMEYCEYKGARTLEEMNRELVHLASACLLLWRKLNHAE